MCGLERVCERVGEQERVGKREGEGEKVSVCERGVECV